MSSLFASKVGSPQKDLRVTDEEFIQLRDFIYQQSGIYIAENRKYLIENRLSNRIKELNLKSFGEYCYYLRFDPKRKDELVKLFASITTNETSFYRNPPQLQVFQDIILKRLLEDLRLKKSKRLRIWSAGCSTGEEPYTLAIILQEVLKAEIGTWDIKINAMDLSEPVLASARRGVYSDYALRTTPKEIVNKYFIFRNNLYEIKPESKRLVNFMQGNLSDRFGLKRLERSHIVFCRNVIIYFDDNMKKQVVASFYDNLLPGGYMFIGHSESLHNISRGFKPEAHPGSIVYLKES
jgi:chemotaxis protein methyltransferase CheR